MKRDRIKSLILLTLILLSIHSYSQQWEWDWGTSATAKTKQSYMSVIHVDEFNNIYCRVPYVGPIYIEDTIFNFGVVIPSENNAFAKYNSMGQFQKAFNVRNVMYSHLQTDEHQCTYIAGHFYHHMWVGDSLIYMNEGSSSNHEEVFLAKINQENELVWVGLISNQWEDKLSGFCTAPEGQGLYLTTAHYESGGPIVLNYFDQKTSLPFIWPMSTLVKVDTNCSIQWIKEVRSINTGTRSKNVFNGQDGNLYLFGDGYGHFHMDQDTIFYPDVDGLGSSPKYWLLKFDHDGNLLDGFYFDWDIWVQEVEVDVVGNIYVAGSFVDTAIIAQDTIIVPDGLYARIVGKFNPNLQPLWYHLFEEQSNQDIYFRGIELAQDHVIFAGGVSGTISIGDTTYIFGNSCSTLVLGEYNQEGELVNFESSDCQPDFSLWEMMLDNCDNPIVSGLFKDNLILGPISLTSFNNDNYDGFVAKMNRGDQDPIDLGNDTTACNSFTIQAPPGYEQYIWDGVPVTDNWLDVSSSGKYTLFCGNGDGCFHYGEIEITIDKAEEINLGPDVIISENDTLILEINMGYDWYYWSDGTFNNKITIVGSEYGIGNHTIWVEGTKGECVHSDTILVQVNSEFGLFDTDSEQLEIFPNPFGDSFVLKIRDHYFQASIYNLNGICVANEEFHSNEKQNVTFSLRNLPKGIYLLSVYTHDGMISTKIIKN